MRNHFLALKLVVAIALTSTSVRAAEPIVGRLIGEFKLIDVRGKETSLSDLREHDVLVVAFLGTECPQAKLYAPRLAKLEKEFRARGVGFISINSNVQDTLAEMTA